MAKVNVNDRASLEHAYPPEIYANDAAQNERAPHEFKHGVLIASGPDESGSFDLARARRHAGEPETPHFLAPTRRGEELIERGQHQAARQASDPKPTRGYARFLDDVIVAAKRFGFRAEQSPGRGDRRLRGFRGG